MGVKKNYKEGAITIEATKYKENDIIVKSAFYDKHKIVIKHRDNDSGVVFDADRAAHLWPILKLYAETGKIFEDEYYVNGRQSGGYIILRRSGGVGITFTSETREAAQLVCDAMNEAARMEES